MATCKVCNGKGAMTVKDDVWKHLTGRGKPPKIQTCPECNGTGQTESSGSGCFWAALLIGIVVFLGLIAQQG